MLCFVLLSVGATFAADNASDVIAIDDEISIDEPLAIEQDVQKVSANESATDSSAAVITPSTVDQYISGSGKLNENVTADELVFEGTFDNLNLTVERPITITGGLFNDPNFEIYSSNVILKNFTILQDKGVSSIFVSGISETNHTENVTINDVQIGFTDDQSGASAVPIEVFYSDNFILSDSNISYTGKTNGYYVNNIIRIESSKNALIFNNEFIANLLSVPVGWAEEPAGSGNWVSSPMSEGIVVKNSEGAIFNGNNLTIYCANFSGSYDTIYAVDFSGSDSAVIAGNKIIAYGNSYIYGIILSGDDFIIRGNDIKSTGVYYADGIDIEGPATGVVEENNINVKAETSAYGIYSGMNGQNASANYTGNNITGNAYNVFGFSLGDVESNVVKNYINLDGNYTTGLAARTGVLNVTENRIVLISSEEGNESVWEGFGVAARGIFAMTGNVTIDNNIIATSGTGVFLTGVDDADVKNNFINVVANTDKDAYGIYAGVLGGLSVLDNNIDYEGATQGTGINNALFIAGTDGALVFDNNFTVDLVSVPVAWAEEPAGSGNWVSSPVSEGIVVKYSNGVIFDNNKVNVTYGDVVGAYDTIYAVDFVESNDSIITNNHIVAKGYTYIYGIILSGDNFIIRANNIDSTGDYYANGIDIEGPATGVVEDNVIDVAANTSAYAIYSGMNGQDVKANYTGNKITGDAYNVFGFSLGDVESNIDANVVMLDGNYTTGIAYRGDVITVTNNTIYAIGSNEGDESVWEAFGVESIGVKVVKGNATIANNTYIVTTGDYPINVQDNVAVVNDNYLVGKRFIGDEGVANAGNSEVYNNTPEIGNKTSSTISVTGVDGDCNVTGVLVYEDGEPISNVDVQYTINGVSGVVKTDANGTFIIAGIDNGKLDIIFGGDSYTNSSNTTITLKDIAPVKQATAVNVTVGEITDKNTNVTVDIPGATGNVSVIIDGIETVVPLVNGSAVVPVENITVGEHDVVVVYLGDDNHAAAYNVSSIFLEGFATEFANITVNGGGLIDAALVNSLGSPMVNATVTYKVDGVEYNTTTDDLGKFYINITGKSVVEMYYAGDDYFSPSNVTIKLENIAPAKETSVLVSSDYTQYACDFYADERGGNFTFQLVDEMGNPLANKTVYIGYNGVTLNGTTDANGKAAVQINLMNAGLYTFVIVFLGDEDYNATMAVHKVTINKKTTSIAASAKTFKATAKTKKYTVTLKTIKGASVDGKTYLKAGKKVTMKINGKTYTGKTNAKGQVTFSIKLTKKGKFAAKISYAGDVTYKASSASVKITIK